MRKALILLVSLMIPLSVQAATKTETWYGQTGMDTFEWNNITTADDTAEVLLKRRCGVYEFHVEGTEDSVDLKLQHGKTSGALEDINTAQMPDGVRFSSASTGNKTNVQLSAGYVDIVFSSAGGATQDIDIWMSYLGECE